MSEDLPKRLFKEGEEPRVTQINNNCRIDYIIRKFQAAKGVDVVKKDLIFHQIFKLHDNGLGYLREGDTQLIWARETCFLSFNI